MMNTFITFIIHELLQEW